MKNTLKKKLVRFLIAALLLMSLTVSAFAATVTATKNVNVRKKADADAAVIEQVKKGTSFTYAGYTRKDKDGNNWFAVKYNGKNVGFVSAKYAKLREDKAAPEKKATPMVVANRTCNVRDIPTMNGSNVVYTMKKGKKLECLEVKTDRVGNSWYKVNIKGKVGWVSDMCATLK